MLTVWLPMNGNLHNQGLNNVTVVNHGAVVNNSGKIGQCYQFGPAASDISLPAAAMTKNTTECSVAFWLNILSWNSNYATFFQAGTASSLFTAYHFGFLRNNTNSTCCFSISDGSTSSRNSYLTPAFDLNKWYHITLVYKTGHCLIYINGQLYKDYTTSIVPNFAGISAIKIGKSANGSSYQANCLMNDFRIYNHALSPKEVEEVAKGLILHYKLDNNGMGGNNLVTNTLFNSTYSPWFSVNHSTLSIVTKDGKKCLTATKGDTDSLFGYSIPGYVAGEKVTLSISGNLYADAATTIKWNIMLSTPEASGWQMVNATDKQSSGSNLQQGWNHVWYTVTLYHATYSGDFKIVLLTPNSTALYLYHPKIEYGNKPTSYIPHINEMHLPTDIIYDSSGYSNNGAAVGNLSAAAGSPRYDIYTQISNDSYIRVKNKPAICMPKDSITINLWIKFSAQGHPISCTEGGGWNFEEDSTGLRFSVYISGLGYRLAQSTIKSTSLKNTWHMLTGTRSKEAVKFYIDGEERGMNAINSANDIGYANNYIFIGAEASGNTITPSDSLFEGGMSDVRIYATELTPIQIKELYNTSMSVDASGNVYARELSEL